MVKRTVEISSGPCRLRVEDDQLVIEREKQEVGRVPIEDVGFLILDERAVTLTAHVLDRVIRHGGVVVTCDERHTPAGLMLSMNDNGLTARRLRAQAAMSAPRRKRLWQQVVRHKVTGQALNLPEAHAVRNRLLTMADEVRSGDTSNIEGQAARFYWPAMLGENFRRDPDGPAPNSLLNYGYMIFRAACARAVVAAGLHPVFSLQHSHRANAFALADDLVEVFRPGVDRAVRKLIGGGRHEIDRESKRVLLGLLAEPVMLDGQAGPLMVQLGRIAASLVDCIEETSDRLLLPSQPLKGIQLLPAKYARQADEPDSP